VAWFYYIGYLAVVLASALLIANFAKVKINAGRFLKALLPVFVVFVLWDVVAVALGHWQFGLQHMLGVVIYNQPIEEIAFFAVVPLFYVVVWETVKKKIGK